MRKKRSELSKEDNPTAYDRLKRNQLSCSRCPPHQSENASRKAKHGSKKPKYKNKRG